MIQTVSDNILQNFSKNAEGQLCLTFSDPAYVSSEIIIFERKDSSFHAVLHGASHFIGFATPGLSGSLKHNDEIVLTAPHYFSGEVHMRSKISVF